MKRKTVKNLERKGWSKKEIKKTADIIHSRTRFDKSRTIPASNRIVFWTAFIIIIIANFLISLTLIPFLLVLNKGGLDFIIIVIGVTFGILFTFLINLAHISKSHHLFAGIMIPVIAIFNFVLITYLSNSMNSVLKLTEVKQNPVLISSVYVAAFVSPYIVDFLLKKYH